MNPETKDMYNRTLKRARDRDYVVPCQPDPAHLRNFETNDNRKESTEHKPTHPEEHYLIEGAAQLGHLRTSLENEITLSMMPLSPRTRFHRFGF